MSQRFEGRNLEEALQAASQGLGVERWQMAYHVVLEKRGFLGGMKRVVIEADVNAEAPPPPQPLQPLPRVENAVTPAAAEAPAPRDPRTERQPRGSNSGMGESGGGGGERGERGARGAGGGRGGAGRGAGGRGGGARGGAGRGSNGRGEGRGRRGGGGGGPRRETRDDLQVGDFEQFLTADVPEQGSESDEARLVHGWIDEVLSLSRLDVVARTEENETQIIVRLYGRDTARLTDRHGEVLDAIQVLANKALVGRKVEKEIELDAAAFKDKRMEELGQQARAAADRVRREGREELLPAMTPIERRIVHLALRDDADVTTESRGEGFYKRVAIILRSEAAPPAEPES